MSLQVLAANKVLSAKVLAADEDSNDGGSDGSSDGSKRVEPKTGKSKSQKVAKSQKLAKSGKSKGKKSKNHQQVGIHLISTLKIAG